MIGLHSIKNALLEDSMLEGILMLCALSLMGVYFLKSSDLPSDLKARQVQLEKELLMQKSAKKFVVSLKPRTSETKETIVKIDIQKEIDKITFRITELESQLTKNKLKNVEIQSEIDSLILKLEQLNSNIA